jgi:hypothetical protein
MDGPYYLNRIFNADIDPPHLFRSNHTLHDAGAVAKHDKGGFRENPQAIHPASQENPLTTLMFKV